MVSTEEVLATTWAQQRRWSLAADRQKRALQVWSRAALACAISGAVLETAATQVPASLSPWLAGLGAVPLGLVAVIQSKKLDRQSRAHWVRCRANAEALKSAVFRCLAGTGDYATADRGSVLLREFDTVQEGAHDLHDMVAGVEPDERPLPPVTDPASYAVERPRRQMDTYYKPAAARENRAARRFHDAQFWLAVLAALLGAVAGYLASHGEQAVSAWVAVVTTISGALAAHAAVGRHDQNALIYEATASELDRLLLRRDELGPDRFVDRCEQVISIQNAAWVGRLPRDRDTGGGPAPD